MSKQNYTLELPLSTENYQLDILNKRFRVAEIMYNKLLSEALNRLIQLRKNTKYKKYLNLYINSKDKILKKEYSKELTNIRKVFKLTEYDLQAYGVKLQHKYKTHIDSNTMQKLASTVFKAIESILYKSGKKVHFKKYNTLSSVEGKSNKSGIRFKENKLYWNGLVLDTYIKKDDYFAKEALENPVKYCRIVRKPFNSGFKYYIQLVIGGIPPIKRVKYTGMPRYIDSPDKRVGIDIGTSTVAVVSDDTLILQELAPKIDMYNKRIKQIQLKMDSSKRKLNPNKYNENGTINTKNKEKWVYSKNYNKLRWRLKSLYRKRSAYVKNTHNKLANEILTLGSEIYVETMNFNALSKRSKTLEKSPKISTIKTKRKVIKLNKYKRKKRFGKSINNRAPALLIIIINQKLSYIDKHINKINTKKFKASQYSHITNTYTKKELNERWNNLNGDLIQRDLYSAFLIKNSNKSLDKTDRDLCKKEYKDFVKKHNSLMKELKANKVKNKNFGI